MVDSGNTSQPIYPMCPWAQQAVDRPDAPAFLCQGLAPVTWQMLDERIAIAAEHLIVIPQKRLAWVATQTCQDAVILAAAMRAGKDLALFGSRWLQARIAAHAGELGAHVIDPKSHLAESYVAESYVADSDLTESVIAQGPEPAEQKRDPIPTLSGRTMIATSGSSGDVKWIVHRAAAHLTSAEAVSERLSLGPKDRWGWCLPAHHVGGLSILWRSATSGATVVELPEGQSLTAWLPSSDEDSPTVLSLVPTQLSDLLEAKVFAPASLHSVIVGGASLSARLLDRALDAGWPIRTTYGMTETGSMVTLSGVWKGRVQGAVHSGRELGHARLDSRDGRIHVQSFSLAENIPHADGWLASSDRGFQNDQGRWVIEGRMDRIIISGGENIDPARIEQAIKQQIDVLDCIVVGVPDARYGERPVAFIKAAQSSIDSSSIAQALESELAAYEMPDLFLTMPLPEEGELKPSMGRLKAAANKARSHPDG